MTPTDFSLPGVPLRDLEQRWGLSRNGLKARARALGVELERVSSTLTLWPGDFVELGDRLDDHLKEGKPMGTFPGLAPADHDGGSAASGGTAITKQAAQSEMLATAIAQAISATTLSLPAPDPLRRAKALAEAADNGLVLTTDELAALGVKGVGDFADGDEAYGYRFSKHHQRNRVLWTVERTIGRAGGDGTVTALPAKRSVGFAGAIEAQCQMISTSIELPSW